MENKGKNPYDTRRISKTSIGRFTIVKDEIILNGKAYPYSYAEVDDCVCILPIIGDDVILIKQYRHAFNEWFLEIPAGGINGEEPETAARRELIEETGYEADELIYRGVYPVSQGTSTARAFFFYC